MSLSSKMIVAISILLLLIMAPFSYINVRAMRQLLFEEAVTEAENISETILKTTHYEMLEDNRTRVYQMIQEAGKQHGIEHIRMITKDGKIIFSTEREEIGAYVDKSAAACDMCHSGERPLRSVSSMNRSRVFAGKDNLDVLGITKAVYNQESCYTAPCHFHPRDQNILGVLDTVISLAPMRAQVRTYTELLIAITTTMLLAIAGSIALLLERLVNRPIKEILGHTTRLGDLEFGTRINVQGRDEIAGLATSFNDMTEKLEAARNELEQWARTLEVKVEERTHELKQMQSQLIRSEKLASLGEIVAGIAHELNNPLTGILVLCSLMEKQDSIEESIREDLATVVHESKRCARIVKGLLDFSRVTTPQKSMANLNEIMENTLALIGTQSIFHNVTLDIHYDQDLPSIMVDANQIEQVFINMLINAAQAMPLGGTLTLETSRQNDSLFVDISDTGSGIPEELVKKIFDPFFSTKENKGTGLGLSVSYGIIENHGGTIEVRSEEGKGTHFRIRFPITVPPRIEEQPSAAA